MIKVITLVKRKEGLSLDEFSKYWEEKHGPLAMKHLPGVRKYVQNHAVRLSSGEPKVDGVVELWYDDFESYRAAVDFYLGDDGKVIRDDEERFINRSKMVSFIAEEKVIKQ